MLFVGEFVLVCRSKTLLICSPDPSSPRHLTIIIGDGGSAMSEVWVWMRAGLTRQVGGGLGGGGGGQGDPAGGGPDPPLPLITPGGRDQDDTLWSVPR